jgi:hypothetical protein
MGGFERGLKVVWKRRVRLVLNVLVERLWLINIVNKEEISLNFG